MGFQDLFGLLAVCLGLVLYSCVIVLCLWVLPVVCGCLVGVDCLLVLCLFRLFGVWADCFWYASGLSCGCVSYVEYVVLL